MSQIGCGECGGYFDAAQVPLCPTCLVTAWLATATFVRPKHDPNLLPLMWEGYRSVLSPDFVAAPRPHLEFAARSGNWYRDAHYEMFVHMTHEPMGLAPGSGIPEGKAMPEHSLDSLLIAEANSESEAHAFAVSRDQFEAQIRAGEFVPLASCPVEGCDNLRVPGKPRCTEHAQQIADDAGRMTRS
jgi:hypothetical protein